MAERNFEERTFAPTPRRREEARRRGEAARSRDLMVALSLLACFLALRWAGPRAFAELTALAREVLASAGRPVPLTMDAWREALARSWPAALALAPLALIAPAAAAAGAAAQGGLVFRLQAAAPRASRLDPAAGLRRLCGGRGAGRALFALAKLGAVAWAAAPFGGRVLAIAAEADPLAASGGPWALLASEALDLGMRASLVLVALAVLDLALERRRFERDLRMTPAEAREEIARIEGDPEWKAQRRSSRARIIERARESGRAGGGS